MIIREPISHKIAISILGVIFVAGLALPDLFAAGLGSGGKKGGSSSSSSSMGKGAGSPIISEKSSPSQSGTASGPTGSSQSSTTPLSTSTESQTSYRTHSQPDTADTSASPEGSIGSEATSAGGKKTKTGGGFPPIDNTIVTGSPEPDTAMAIRGKPAHSEETPTRAGSDISGGGSSDKSEGLGGSIEKAGREVIKEAGRLPENIYEKAPLVPWWSGGGAGHEVLASPKRVVEDTMKQVPRTVNDASKQAERTADWIERLPEASGLGPAANVYRDLITAPAAKAIERGYRSGREQLGKLEDKAGTQVDKAMDQGAKQLEGVGKEVKGAPKNIERAINEAERGLNLITPDLPETMTLRHLIKEGDRTITGPIGDAIQKIERLPADLSSKTYGVDDVIRDRVTAPAAKAIEAEYGRARDQMGNLENKVGATIGKGMKKAGEAYSDAKDTAEKVADQAKKKAEDVAQQGQEAAEDAGNSASDTAEQGCDAVAGVFGGNC